MKSRLTILTLLFIINFTILSCNKNKESIEKKISNTEYSKMKFDYKLKNKQKLFLKYWEDMNEEEYAKVSELLLQEKLIRKISFEPFMKVEKNYFYFETRNMINPVIIPTFVNQKLSHIELFFQAKYTFNYLYELYKEKYNLPILDSICTITDCYKENNPKYKHYKTEEEKKIDEFNESPIDNSNFLTSVVKVDKNKYENDYYSKVLPKNLKVEKDNILIKFAQTKITKQFSYNTSEIIGGKAFKNYIYSLDNENHSGIIIEGSYKQINSKNRIVIEYYLFNYKIIYIPKSKELEIEKKQQKSLKELYDKIDTDKNENEKVNQQNFNSI